MQWSGLPISNETINILKNGDKVRIWKESSKAYLNLLYQHSPGNSENKMAFMVSGYCQNDRVLSYSIKLTNSMNRVCPGKLTGSQLIKKFPTFY